MVGLLGNSLPPGLAGFVTQRQLAGQDDMRNMAQVQGLLGVQQAQMQQGQMQKDMELRGLLGQKLRAGDQEGAKQILMQIKPELFAANLVPKPQEAFTLPAGAVRFGPDGKQIAAAPMKEQNQSNLARLLAERDNIPPNDPRRHAYDNAIRKESETAKQISPTIVMPRQDAGLKAPAGFRFTPDGNLERIPGGPADLKAEADLQKKAAGVGDVDVALGTLRDAYSRLESGGGITSTKNNPLSNVIPSLSSSGAGQAAGKLFGTSNQSARNDIAMARPALLAALMKATGMSAKQMDSNAELKLWLATATDPTLDVESNRRALDSIEKKYLSGSSAPASGGSTNAPQPGTIKDGYRFKGGNPADKNNWEKVNG